MKQFCLSIVILTGSISAATAAPPESCRDKFVGTWKYFGGSTEIRADGTAVPSTGVKLQTWTCSGNIYTFSNPDGQTWTAELSADGKKLKTGGSPYTATRVRSPKANSTVADNKNVKKTGVGKPELVRANREPGFENCTAFKVIDKDYQVQARLFNQDPPHQWSVLINASSSCKVPIIFNACVTFHSLKFPEERGGGEHFIGINRSISNNYHSSGFPLDGKYSYNVRFCQHGKGPCKVSCL